MDDQELVDALCEIEDGLSEWEVDFVESIAKSIKTYGSLTPKQRGKAEDIYDQKG